MLEKLKGNRWFTLLIISIGFLMILIDTTVVNVSIPTIIKDLHATLPDVEWIISAYALSFAALLITFGRIGDLYGRKHIFILGLFVFTVASIASGEAPNALTLIFARIFQGIGGAMISPSTLSILSGSFQGKERSIAFGIWGATAGVAVAIGPILGGFLTTYYSWRWVFRINVPIGILGMLAAAFFIVEAKDKIKQKLDISGMIASTLGFFFFVYGLIEGQNYGWWKPNNQFSLGSYTWTNKDISIIPFVFAASTIFLVLFVIIQVVKTKRNMAPAINIDFFKSRAFRYGLIAVAVISLGEFSSLFTLPIFLQGIKGFTPLQSGYAVLPLAIGTLVAAPTSARLVNVFGTKWIISLGISLEFLGLFLLSRLNAHTEYSSLIIPYAVMGIGIGLAIAQNTQVILSDIPHQNAGSASGVLNTIRQVGSALGIAVIGAVLASQLSTNIKHNITAIQGIPDTAKQQIITQANQSNIASDTGNTPSFSMSQQIPPAVAHNPIALKQLQEKETLIKNEITDAIHTSLADAIAISIRVGAIFVLIGAFLSLFIPNIKHKD